MGINFSGAPEQSTSVLDQYSLIEQRIDSSFGDIMIMEHNVTKKIQALKEICFQDIDTCQIEESKIKHKQQSQHPNLVNLVDYQIAQEDNLCAKSFKLTFVMEFFNQTLDKEIFNRRAQNNLYNEDEMWFFLESVINALFYLQINNIQHGDIRLSSIYITQDGQYKITEPTITKQLSQFEKLTQSIDSCLRGMYLAPELLYNLHAKVPYIFSCFKSDIMQVIPTEVEAKLEQMKQVYSPSLVKFIGSMLEFQPSRRPDFQQLAEQLLFQGRATIRMTYKKFQGETDIGDKSGIMPTEQINTENLNNNTLTQQIKIPVDTIERTNLEQNNPAKDKIDELKNVTLNVVNQPQKQQINSSAQKTNNINILAKQEKVATVFDEFNNTFKENLIIDNATLVKNKENTYQFAYTKSQLNDYKLLQPEQAQQVTENKSVQIQQQQYQIINDPQQQMCNISQQQIKVKSHSRANSFSGQNESLAQGFNIFQVNNLNETNFQQNMQTPKLYHDFSIENLKQILNENNQNQNVYQDINQSGYNLNDPAQQKQNISYISQNPEQQETMQALHEVQKEIEMLKQKYSNFDQVLPEDNQQLRQQAMQDNQSHINQTLLEDQITSNRDRNASVMKSPISRQYNKAATAEVVSPPIGFLKYNQTSQGGVAVHEQYSDGSYYQGQKVNNQRHGNGRFVYSDGAYYEGNWVNGSINGYGKLYYANNKLAYEGEWRNDKFHGRGTIYNEEIVEYHNEIDYRDLNIAEQFWVKFEGDFDEDEKMGFGTYYYSNGSKFQGTFCKDMATGIGTFYKSADDIMIGEWKENIVVNIFSTSLQMSKDNGSAKAIYAGY